MTTNLINHEEAKVEPTIIINDEKQRSPVPLKSTQNVQSSVDQNLKEESKPVKSATLRDLT